MFYLVIRQTSYKQGQNLFPRAAHKILRTAAKSSESRELQDEQRRGEIRVLFFCCDECANDHVPWPRLKRGIQLLGEQL